ncbi:MAG: hypothetical protein AB7E55_32435 [Pigmentiphaga sp.]|nr:hypothetical protein [Pandoraea sputorum]RRW87697.1 hypothetical protein EGJ54_25320 [Pandoraea apista]RRW96186.1 hypothetical protein EGJ56_25335 [Pandoraea apista]
MKKITIAAALAIGFACSTTAFAANHVGQCVFPKTKIAQGGRLVMKSPINLADAPNTSASKRALTSMEAFTIKAQAPGGYVQLVTVPDYDKPNPNQNAGRVVGWAKLSDFDFQDQRNCN